MEILSDATFRGATIFKKDVTISSADFFVKRSDNNTDNTYSFYVVSGCSDRLDSDAGTEIVHIEGNTCITGQATINSLSVGGSTHLFGSTFAHRGITTCGGMYINGCLELSDFNTIRANGKLITFPSQAGTLALTSDIPSVPSVAGFLKYKKIPIDFDVPADCTVFDTNSGASLYADRVISIGLFKTETPYNNWAFAIKQVQADVLVMCIGFVVVEKSSAFSISPSDGYEIRVAYYE